MQDLTEDVGAERDTAGTSTSSHALNSLGMPLFLLSRPRPGDKDVQKAHQILLLPRTREKKTRKIESLPIGLLDTRRMTSDDRVAHQERQMVQKFEYYNLFRDYSSIKECSYVAVISLRSNVIKQIYKSSMYLHRQTNKKNKNINECTFSFGLRKYPPKINSNQY